MFQKNLGKSLGKEQLEFRIMNEELKIILIIDTARRDEVKVAVKLNDKTYEKIAKNIQSQNVLKLISQLLKSKKIKLSQIKEIKVNTGPGSFTGLRVGVAVANALGFALKIPVNGKEAGKIQPTYE